VPVSYLFNCVCRQDAGGVDCVIVYGIPLQNCHWKMTLLISRGPARKAAARLEVVHAEDVIGTGSSCLELTASGV